MIRLLFVDDEQSILDGLRRTLRSMRPVWEAAFVTDGSAALEALNTKPYHAIVTDMRMPQMDGLTLLKEIKERHPDLLRVVLSGQSEMESVVKAAGVAHHYLTKPCAMDMLRSTVERAFSLRRLFSQPTLLRMGERLQTPDESRCHLPVLVQLLSAGQSTASHSNPNTCSCAASSQAERSKGELRSIYAERIARMLVASDGNLHGQARAAALQADVGQMLMRCRFSKQYEDVEALVAKGTRHSDAEAAVFGTTHAECSAYVLAQAGFPEVVIEAVAYHHSPSACPDPHNHILLAIHLADALVSENEGDLVLDSVFLKKIGQVEDLAEWRAVVALEANCHV